MMTFKEKLVVLRKIKHLTQDEFASAVGVSRQAVYKWESGQSYPEVQKLIEMKMLFGISIDDLLDDTFEIELPKKKRKKRMTKEEKERIEAEKAAMGIAPKPAAAPKAAPTPAAKPAAPAPAAKPATPAAAPAAAPAPAAKPAAPAAAPAPAAKPAAPAAAPAATPKADDNAQNQRGFFGRLFGKK